MRKPHRIALLFSDLHLSLQKPHCRAEDDWLAVQESYLNQLKDIAKDLPIIFAGDLFDRWNSQPELINFALKHLPDGMVCIPGQHDLPNHQLDQVHRSGYGVLVEAGKIRDISGGATGNMGGFIAFGFGWGQKIEPPEETGSLIRLAVIHRYCGAKGKTYPGAPKDCYFSEYANQLKGYDAAVFGDNHMGFQGKAGGCSLINTGTFIRRKSDEKEYQPRVGVLYSDGSIKTKYLETNDKFWTEDDEREELPIDMQDFIQGLEELGEHGLNFREAVETHLKTEEIDERTKQIILESLDA